MSRCVIFEATYWEVGFWDKCLFTRKYYRKANVLYNLFSTKCNKNRKKHLF